MKTIIILSVIAGVVGVILFYAPTSEIVVNERVATSTVEVRVDVLEERIKAAQEAAHNEIEAEVDEYRQQLLKEVEDAVKAEYITEIEATITSNDY